MRYIVAGLCFITWFLSAQVQAMTEPVFVRLNQGDLSWFEPERAGSFGLEVQPEFVRVALSSPEVLNVQVHDKQLLLFALAPGYSKVSVWFADGTQQEIRVEVYSKQRFMLEQFLALYIQANTIVQHVSPEKIWLSGQGNATDKENLLALAEVFSELDLSQLNFTEKAPQMVEMEVQVVELKRSYLKQHGLSWSPAAQGPAVGVLGDWLGGRRFRLFSEINNTGGTLWQPELAQLAQQNWSGLHGYLGLQTSLSSTLRLLEERGEARILATPKLRLESGESAHFLAGGELPIPQLNRDGAMDVSFHPYGIQINTAVEVQRDGLIRTSIEAELSRIDYAVAVQGIPGLLTRRSRSVVILPARETIVLSGLKSSEEQNQRSGLPGHRNVWQGIGQWLSGREDSKQETELLIFLTPRMVAEEEYKQRQQQERTQAYRQHLHQAKCHAFE